MRILWVINISLPEASELMGEKPSPFGGWLINSSELLSKQANVELVVAFPSQKSNKYSQLHGVNIKYYPFSKNMNNFEKGSLTDEFKYILSEVNPDIVHIYGTEMQHTLPIIKLCRSLAIEVVVSIQGLVSVISKHYLSGIPQRIQYGYTFRDFIKQDNIKQQQKEFYKKGVLEVEAINNVRHLIGRTTWDKACINQINPKATYHFCNEILRKDFYNYQWSIDHIDKYSIFISQGTYPIKGLHYMIEALSIILQKYPNAKLYISGNDITKSNSLRDKLKKTTYAKFIEELIIKYELKDAVEFLGLLNEKEMCDRYLKSNVFVCPSVIENSPNSLGEAMILGVPCVASNVGGIPDMIKHTEEGFLYQHDAPYMLAHYVCEIFQNDRLAQQISQNARVRALKTHEQELNTNRLIEIYNNIINFNPN